MTLKTEIPISIEHKIHRIQHHHHYHLHHVLESHHLYIHNESFRNYILEHQENLERQRAIGRGAGNQDRLSITSTQSLPALISSNNYADPQQTSDTLDKLHQRPPQRQYQSLANVGTNAESHVIVPHHNQHYHQRDEPAGSNQLFLERYPSETSSASSLQSILSSPTNQLHQPCKLRRHDVLKSTSSKQRSQIQFFLMSAFAYILSPIDLIPEMIFGVFGILDDLLFLFLCLFCVAIVLLYPLLREIRQKLFRKLGAENEHKHHQLQSQQHQHQEPQEQSKQVDYDGKGHVETNKNAR